MFVKAKRNFLIIKMIILIILKKLFLNFNLLLKTEQLLKIVNQKIRNYQLNKSLQVLEYNKNIK